MLQLLYFSYGFITIGSYFARGTELNYSITTEVIRDTPFPKPTTVNKSKWDIRVDGTSSTLDALQRISSDGRRKKNTRSYILIWDRWCQLQPKTGNCEKSLTKYFYDVQLDQCSPFIYSGCDGNKNNFDTLLDCERHCKGTTYMKIDDFTQPSFCYLQPEPGLCLALFIKYYYDVNEKSCKQFIYGGCGGNQNKFDTMFSCTKTCQGQ